jgi:hypothetical protein
MKKQHEELYKKHSKLLHKAVWKACKKFPQIPRDYVLSDAHEIFCNCCEKWEPEKGVKFSTYLTQALKNSLAPAVLSGSDSVLDNDGYDPEQVGVNGMCSPERLLRLKQALSNMKPLAVEVVNMVFNPPAGLESITKEGFRKYLRKAGIGSADIITETFGEIRQTLKEV